MSPELSRRVARALQDSSAVLSLEQRDRFVDAVEKADSFEDLAAEWQQLLLRLEERLSGGVP